MRLRHDRRCHLSCWRNVALELLVLEMVFKRKALEMQVGVGPKEPLVVPRWLGCQRNVNGMHLDAGP